MTTIKHPRYKEFYDTGIIQLFTHEQFKTVYNNITDPFGREMFVLLYYTGARPVQLLKDFTTSHIEKDGNSLKIHIPPAKGGKPFTFFLSLSKFGLTDLWRTCQKLPPNTKLFGSYMQTYVRTKTNKKGVVKEYIERSDRFRYYFRKWVSVLGDDPIPPYFLRHSRFSSMSMEGATSDDIMLAKGATSFESVRPYQHMSKERSKKMQRFIK